MFYINANIIVGFVFLAIICALALFAVLQLPFFWVFIFKLKASSLLQWSRENPNSLTNAQKPTQLISSLRRLKGDWPNITRPEWAVAFVRQREIPGFDLDITGKAILKIAGRELPSQDVYLGQTNYVGHANGVEPSL